MTVLLYRREGAASSVEVARALERRLFDAGYQSLALGEGEPAAALEPLSRAGIVSIVPLRDADTAGYASAGSAPALTLHVDSATTIDELTRRILEAVEAGKEPLRELKSR